MSEVRVHRVPFSNPTESPGAGADLFAACRDIRRRVFIDEQSVSAELEWDGLDAVAEHFAAVEGTGKDIRVLATARMRIVDHAAKAERVAVLPHCRRLGLGRRLMGAIEARAVDHALTHVRLNAQVSAAPFYDELGYQREGQIFLEAGIEHVAMFKALDSGAAR